MIKVETISKINFLGHSYKKETQKIAEFDDEGVRVDLNKIPHYGVLPVKNPFIEGEKALRTFKFNYGKPKSPDYIEAVALMDKTTPEKLTGAQEYYREYSEGYDKMRMTLDSYGNVGNSVYCTLLKNYIRTNNGKHGAYLKSPQCALLMDNILKTQGVDSKMVIFTLSDKRGHKIPKIEHVFNLLNVPSDADITNPSTWGKDAVICDIWMYGGEGMCDKASEVLKEYKNLFNINDKKEKLNFEPYNSFHE